MSESGIWPSRDRRSGEGNEVTGGPGLYNKQVETRTIGAHPDNAFIPASSHSSQTSSISSPHNTRNTQAELDMRTISLRTVFGLNASLTTSVPGRVNVSTRANSVPLISHQKRMDKEMDVEMGDSTTSTTKSSPKSKRTQSEYIIRIPHDEEMEVEETRPHVTHPPVIRRDCYNVSSHSAAVLHIPFVSNFLSIYPLTQTPKSTLADITETPREDTMDASATEDNESQHAPQRALSPAATEVDDPESQDIIADIQTRGVKVRDFAYAPPYPRPTAPLVPVATAGSFAPASTPTTSTPPESVHTTYTTTTHTPALQPVTEIFDPYTKIAEVDYRWSQSPRTYPVAGKSLRRLLDLGWITPAELAARAAPMDLAALEAFDARKPVYPWRSIKWGGKVPGEGERKDMCNARRGFWTAMDRMRERGEGEERRRKEEEERIGKAFNTGGVKRAHDDNDSGEGGDVETKKRRITPEPSRASAAPQPPPSPPTLMPPAKQYPAPLHTYHPSIYPEAASIIESSSQSSSQPRPVFAPAPERFDTPPVDEDGEIVVVGKGKSQSNLDDDEEGGETDDKLGSTTAGRGTKLVHPRERKKMTRVLSRTQTFAQL
jgi:hypothetical protein